MAVKEAKVFTVTSVKGGTGKTTFALNLAATFSKLNYKTLIIDLDVFGGEIALSTNASCDKNLFTVIDDMNNNRFTFIENYVSHYNNNIDILPAPIDPRLSTKININSFIVSPPIPYLPLVQQLQLLMTYQCMSSYHSCYNHQQGIPVQLEVACPLLQP